MFGTTLVYCLGPIVFYGLAMTDLNYPLTPARQRLQERLARRMRLAAKRAELWHRIGNRYSRKGKQPVAKSNLRKPGALLLANRVLSLA